MAEITLSSGMYCRPFRSPWGAFPTRTLPISTGISSAAILLGRPVTLDWTGSTTAGKVIPSTSDATFMLAGIAAATVQGSTAVTNGDLPVWEANPLVEFVANTKNGALASSHVGTHRTLHWDSTLNIAYVDLGASTKADYRVKVTQLIGNEGDTGGAVAFRFLSRLTENIGSSVAVTSTTPILAFYA